MFRKITALFLAMLMLVVATTAQVGLQYCLCEKTLFLAHCPCETVSQNAQQGVQQNDCDCCDCCSSDESLATSNIALLPCDNCTVNLKLDLGHYVYHSGLDYKLTDQDDLGNSLLRADQHNTTELTFKSSPVEIRGSPPPSELQPNIPIYQRYGVFLI